MKLKWKCRLQRGEYQWSCCCGGAPSAVERLLRWSCCCCKAGGCRAGSAGVGAESYGGR
ncbi:hypothetical protein RchiOBHm_Chr2g0164251 [Rosa chinensis]|uniref:Uncharacterized protein n=1 Tax=Rosa chinensis TaxID=74649 RepID=A0A2P6S3H5_ROSCH|nr:hypothetical protein RchiOBHm_Chr2g0164251 [Rosa chinensis]